MKAITVSASLSIDLSQFRKSELGVRRVVGHCLDDTAALPTALRLSPVAAEGSIANAVGISVLCLSPALSAAYTGANTLALYTAVREQ